MWQRGCEGGAGLPGCPGWASVERTGGWRDWCTCVNVGQTHIAHIPVRPASLIPIAYTPHVWTCQALHALNAPATKVLVGAPPMLHARSGLMPMRSISVPAGVW